MTFCPPPITGPVIAEIELTATKIPVNIGRRLRGTDIEPIYCFMNRCAKTERWRNTYNHHTSEDARSSHSSHSPSDDQGSRGGCTTADSRANFKAKNRGHEHPFARKVAVCFPEEELKGTRCEEIRGPVPAYVIKGVEFWGYFGNGDCNDCSVLSIWWLASELLEPFLWLAIYWVLAY